MSKNKPAIIGEFTGKCCDANVVNNNDMHLGRELFENLFASDEYKRAISNRHYIGYLGHPEDPGCQEYEHACITMTECHIEDNDDIVGKFDLIDTPVGRVVKSFIDAGVKFGISIRGAGDVDASGEVDPETFVFRGFDLVTFPAYDDCIPEFREIAASTDVAKQKKFKKVCASINAEIQNISSCDALGVMQEQFPEGSDEFVLIGDRIAELSIDKNEDVDILQAKLDGLTKMYADLAEDYKELEESSTTALVAADQKARDAEIYCKRKIASYKRIMSSQMRDLEADKEDILASMKTLKARNAELSRSNNDLNAKVIAATNKIDRLNLKYNQKMDADSDVISQQNSTIKDLESRLSETVTASKHIKNRASNLDASNQELMQRVEAAEQMVLDYQQAYANMYANALGVHLDHIPVSASTSVEALKDMISAGTSTANIPAAPDMSDEIDDDLEFISGEDPADMVTL